MILVVMWGMGLREFGGYIVGFVRGFVFMVF